MTSASAGDLRAEGAGRTSPVKKFVISALKTVLPKYFRPYAHFRQRIVDETNFHVASGPFKGLVYLEKNYWGAYCAKLLGIYEKELHGVVEQLIARKPDAVVDIGAAEGFYAVGLARRLPESKVIAFEIGEEGRALLDEMAQKNGVRPQLDIRGECQPDKLEDALSGLEHPAVICDVEGYEDVLIDPSSVPSLKKAVILVEIHDFAAPGVGDRIRQRLQGTHRVQEILQTARVRSDYPYPDWYFNILPDRFALVAVREFREVKTKQMSWLYCEPQ